MKDNTIYAKCSLCGNESGYDKQSLKGSTYRVNGYDVILCCPCEDDLKRRLNKCQIKNFKNWIERLGHILMSDDLMDLQTIERELEARYD